MADDTNNQGPVEQKPTEPQQQPAEQVADLGDSGKKAIEAERKARRDADKRAKDLEARLAQFEDANKSETERLTDRAAKAEQQAQRLTAQYHGLLKRQAITEAATTAQTTDAETVYLYLRDEVEVDNDGNVTGLDKALRGLQQRKPHLFRTTPAGNRDAAASTTPPALNSNALEDALRRAVGAN